jgi:hypothetical protein
VVNIPLRLLPPLLLPLLLEGSEEDDRAMLCEEGSDVGGLVKLCRVDGDIAFWVDECGRVRLDMYRQDEKVLGLTGGGPKEEVRERSKGM